MVHLYLLTRGIKPNVDRFVNDMLATYVPHGNGGMVQVAMRPIQLWEVVFPKQHLPLICNTIMYPNDPNAKSDSRYTYINALNSMLRKIIKLKKIPKYDPHTTPRKIVFKDAVAVYPIGIKEDNIVSEELAREMEKGVGLPEGCLSGVEDL